VHVDVDYAGQDESVAEVELAEGGQYHVGASHGRHSAVGHADLAGRWIPPGKRESPAYHEVELLKGDALTC
jgi:hypothetical protein